VVSYPDGGTGIASVTRFDEIWWLLAPNPFVILADSAPQAPSRVVYSGDEIYVDDYDPLSSLGRSIRTLRLTPDPVQQAPEAELERQRDAAPVWPTGLVIQLVLGVGSVAVTTMRLRTPSRKLARGVRVA
jgi:ABC-2 type transport system permease protein